MFKKSKQHTTPNLFENYAQHLSSRKLKHYENSDSWHNVFYQEITSQIDENIFSVLYSSTGRPNEPIRILVGMLILKDGYNWSDEQLYEACNFNILVSRALGLLNLSDQVPCLATYYNFKAKLTAYEKQTGINLLEQSFYKLTKSQILHYEVSGKSVRMDSKLLHSNIAKVTRLQLTIEVLKKFYKSLLKENLNYLKPKHEEVLNELRNKTSTQHTYPLNANQAEDKLTQLGNLAYELAEIYKNVRFDDTTPSTQEAYLLVQKLLSDHFEVIKTVKSDDVKEENPQNPQNPQKISVQPKNRKGLGGTNLQSAHDSEASYRNKKGSKPQKIRGYVSNVSETCTPNIVDSTNQPKPLNLITCVQTQTVTTSDDKFFQQALEITQDILQDKIENVLTDGAYNSATNLDFSKGLGKSKNGEQALNQPINWYLTAIQGAEGFYDFYKMQGDQYRVTDRRTGHIQFTHKTPKGKYRINDINPQKKYRYFDPKTITNYFRRQQILEYPKWVQGARANTEASIHQMFCQLNGTKTKYRGLFKNHCYSINRAFWTNFRRILVYRRFSSNFLYIFCSILYYGMNQHKKKKQPKVRFRIFSLLYLPNFIL